MIKFTALVHKETGTVIKYEDWLKLYSCDNGMELGKHCYHNEQMLFSDDFEIIYDSDFTLQELHKLYGLSRDLAPKIAKSINKKEALFTRYGIEV